MGSWNIYNSLIVKLSPPIPNITRFEIKFEKSGEKEKEREKKKETEREGRLEERENARPLEISLARIA